MTKWHPMEIHDIIEPPPHTERLVRLQRSAEDQQHLALVNAYLVPSAPTETLANGEANGAEEAMYRALACLGAAAGEVEGVMNQRVSDSGEAKEAYFALDAIYRSVVAAREAYMAGQDAWWDRYGDHA